jgi:hypothetical protein
MPGSRQAYALSGRYMPRGTEARPSTALGLSMSAPLVDEPDLTEDERKDPAQSFLVFPPDYYEHGLRRAAEELEAKGDARAAEIVRAQLARLRG